MPEAVPEVAENTNSTDVSVTVSELAARLDVTLPRLQRVLKREPFAALLQKQARATRTGTRTVTCVSVSVIPALQEALREGNNEHKREHLRPLPLVSPTDEQTRAYLEMLTRQADARIAEQAQTIADLRRDKDELRLERERLQCEVLALTFQVQEFRSIGAKQNSPQEATGETNETVSAGVSVVPTQKRRWWWQRRESE